MGDLGVIRLSAEKIIDEDWGVIEVIAHQNGQPHKDNEAIYIRMASVMLAITRAPDPMGVWRRTLVVQDGPLRDVYQETDDPSQAWRTPSSPDEHLTVGQTNLNLMVRGVEGLRGAAERRPERVSIMAALPLDWVRYV